ncbi:MAG: J domain-containing protein [Burkholderiales bacterium]|nr:J domain-containing protein [Burkholderiales bacterium]
MTSTNDLFADQGPAFAPQPDRLEIVAGKVVASMSKPSAAQKRFNTLMARIDAEQQLLQTLRHAMDTHVSAHAQALHQLGAESVELCKRMVVYLDQRLQDLAKPKGLTAVRMLLMLCEQVQSQQDDAQIDAIVQRYAPTDEDDEDAQEDRALMRSLLESCVGSDFAQGREFDSPEDMLHAAMEHEQRKQAAAQAKRDAKRAARKAAKGPSAHEQAAAQKQQDAQAALRTVYRQLASALHPDRESDAQLRARKTAVMSEVNAAYERNDLSTLLRIQLQEEMVDATKAASLSQDRLKAMCDLLAEQVRALEQDNAQLRMAMEHQLGYPAWQRYDEATLLVLMQDERAGLEEDIAHMRADLQRVQDDKELKAWLKEQLRESKANRRSADMLDMDDILHAMMARR